MRIYRLHESTGYGFLKRPEEYWQWLVRCSIGAQILVAVDHRKHRGIKQRGGKIVAYAVISGNEILEILSEPANVVATEQLLTRLCADAIEHNFRTLCLATADSNNGLAELYVATRAAKKGQPHKKQKTSVIGVPSLKLLVRRLSPELLRRWRVTQTSDVAMLGWGLGKHASRLVLNEKGLKLVDGDACPDRLICSQADLDSPTAGGTERSGGFFCQSP